MASLLAVMALSLLAGMAVALSKSGFDEDAAMRVEFLQTQGAQGLAATGETLVDGSTQAAVNALFVELDKDKDGRLGVSDMIDQRVAPNDLKDDDA